MQQSERLLQFPPYVFATLGQRIAEMQAQGIDVIRLDIGNPDLPPAPFIVEALQAAIHQPDQHGYGGYFGQPALRQAMATYYRNRFGVALDPDTQVLPLLGTKEGIFNLALAWVNPGDVVLVPDPGYPTYAAGTRIAEGEIVTLALRAENGFLPDLDAIPEPVARRARLLWLNYPNNPTAGLASLEFFERAVEFARAHGILLCHDAAYVDVTFDGYRAPSVLQVPGAAEVAVEFNSLSKSYNMAGWRVGIAAGHPAAIAALGRIKSNIDSGLFLAVQAAAAQALTGDQSWLDARNAVYRERRDLVIETLDAVGLEARVPQATLYVWVRVPSDYTSATFADHVLRKAAVSLAPGDAFGIHGEGYVRLSLGRDTAQVREAMARIKQLG